MSMSNYLYVRHERSDVMATRESPIGVDHPTIVPENFEPESATNGERDRADPEQ
jgi:hypothetical protein